MSRRKVRGGGRTFAPWRTDYVVAVGAGALAAFAAGRGLVIGTPPAIVAGGVLAAALGWAARTKWIDGRRRQHGHQVERWAVEKIGPMLDRQRLDWRAGQRVPGLGDIDLVVTGRRDISVVEIKSFEVWRQTLFRTGQRERRAIAQVERQMAVVGAQRGIVWLPRARPSILQWIFGVRSGDVRVVFGSPARVVRKVR